MARYIDADKFIERLKASPAFPNMGMDGYFLLDVVENLLKKFPTADVAPKSEVEELIRENESLAKTVNEASELIRKLRSKVDKSKTEVAREIFEEIESMLIRYTLEDGYGEYISTDSVDEFAELKKKYTEGKE
jgi:hypothetical protein